MKCTLRIVIWLRTDRSHEMSVQGSGPLRFETGVVEGDIMKLPYAPSRILETSWCYTSDIYSTYAVRNQESFESGNTRHHCRNGHSLKRWYTTGIVKIHDGNILKTKLRKSELRNITLNGPLCGHQHTWVKNGCTIPTNSTAATFQECRLAGGVGCKREALHGNWCTITVWIKSTFIEIAWFQASAAKYMRT